MKKIITMLFIFLSFFYSKNVFAEDQCHIREVINLSVFKKNDYNFYNYTCESHLGSYLKSYIGNKKENFFVGEYSDFAAKESPELLAVSIYKPNRKKTPLLITINSAYYCCTPQMEGNMYQVNFYETKSNGSLTVKNITNIFGENAEGFEGVAEGRVYYNYKTISEIKKWLDKNYK